MIKGEWGYAIVGGIVGSLFLCGCATTNADGELTTIGHVVNGARSMCATISRTDPETSAEVLEGVGAVLSLLGIGSVSAACFWGANKLRKSAKKKDAETDTVSATATTESAIEDSEKKIA